MQSPNCQHHERLMLDLAFGHLTDQESFAAEGVRRSCPTCASWWKNHLAGPEVADLDREVEGAFAEFAPPRQRRLSDKYPWAVAAVLALAVSFVLQPNRATDTETEQLSEAEPFVIRELFDADHNSDGVVDLSDVTITVSSSSVESGTDQQPLFDGDLESGDLSAWSGFSQANEPGATS